MPSDRVVADIVLFAGPESVCSNLYHWDCALGGQRFYSNEHAYQWLKLRYLGLERVATVVRLTHNSFDMMKTARDGVREMGDDPAKRDRLSYWRQHHAKDVLHHLAANKLTRCIEFKQFIKQHATYKKDTELVTRFYECTVDKYWGIGILLRQLQSQTDEQILHREKVERWDAEGENSNMFGRILRNVVQEKALFEELGTGVLREFSLDRIEKEIADGLPPVLTYGAGSSEDQQ